MNSVIGSTMLQFPSAIFVVLIVALGFVFLSLFAPRTGERFFRRFEGSFARLADQKVLAVFALSFSVIAIRLAILPLLRIPIPGIHDEFSYLLM